MAIAKKTDETLTLINQLILKALDTPNRKSLSFFIANDTCKLVHYDQATLWDIELYNPTPLAVSGQPAVKKDSEVVQEALKKVHKIDDKENMQTLLVEEGSTSSFLWVPIPINRRTTLGLLLERWDGAAWSEEEQGNLQIVAQGYGHAWKGVYPQWTLSVFQKIPWITGIFIGIIFLSIIPIPLRVSAPCEVVAKDPFLVTAPLDGIIEKISVNPGSAVTKGQLLFSYDKRMPLQELEVAQKQFEIADSQLQWSINREAHEEAAVWRLKRESEKLRLDYLQKRSHNLEVAAKVSGVAVFNDPDEWRGRRVMTGEKILVVSNPNRTKLRIWLPKSDNVVIAPDRSIKVFFHDDLIRSYEADLVFVGDCDILQDNCRGNFTAEAEWAEQPKDVKLGSKGTAVLYGPNVPLLYWLLRKPITAIRNFFEV
jgi:Biotin-lipoyl like